MYLTMSPCMTITYVVYIHTGDLLLLLCTACKYLAHVLLPYRYDGLSQKK